LTNLVQWGESTLSGWNHIDVIRKTNGQFYILVNNKLRADPIDATITSSIYFGFVAYGGHALDNITVNDEINVLLKPADLRFYKDSISISNQRGSTNPITFYIYNHGQAPGNATLEVGETPSGINVTLDTEDIINLKDKDRGHSKKVTGTIDILASAAPGVHNVILELHNNTSVVNSMNLIITVEAPEESTTTTTATTTPPTTTEPSTPSSSSPGFEGIFIISALLVIPIFLKKKKRN